jgi:hypothetical protein
MRTALLLLHPYFLIRSGFKTNAVTRSNFTIPPGVVDVVITLSRGNLVKAFSIIAVIAICECYCVPLLI